MTILIASSNTGLTGGKHRSLGAVPRFLLCLDVDLNVGSEQTRSDAFDVKRGSRTNLFQGARRMKLVRLGRDHAPPHSPVLQKPEKAA